VILDTHVAIWVAEDAPLGANVRNQIAAAAREGTLFLSAISAWEVATLVRKNRLRLDMATDQYIEGLFELPGVREIPVTFQIARTAGILSDSFHGDPADRIIVATASLYGEPLLTRDKRILRFAKTRGGFSCVPV
jgi:PIN domain nuclease of toxin-antitoxin system